MVTKIHDINHGRMKFYYFTAYALAVVGVKADQNGNYFFCWLSLSELVSSLIGPNCILLLLTLIIFILSIKTSKKLNEPINCYESMQSWTRFTPLAMLTYSWLILLLTVND